LISKAKLAPKLNINKPMPYQGKIVTNILKSKCHFIIAEQNGVYITQKTIYVSGAVIKLIYDTIIIVSVSASDYVEIYYIHHSLGHAEVDI
jgi:hypothetical protein